MYNKKILRLSILLLTLAIFVFFSLGAKSYIMPSARHYTFFHRYPRTGLEVPAHWFIGTHTLLRRYPHTGSEVPTRGFGCTRTLGWNYPHTGSELPARRTEATRIRVRRYPHIGSELPVHGYEATRASVRRYPPGGRVPSPLPCIYHLARQGDINND
jgi:hypothetical protein